MKINILSFRKIIFIKKEIIEMIFGDYKEQYILKFIGLDKYKILTFIVKK